MVPSRYAYAEAPEEMIQNTKAWGDLAAAHGVSLPAVAVAFGALPECVEKLVIGMASAEEVAENVAWLAESGSVGASLWVEAKQLGLLSQEIPTPV